MTPGRGLIGALLLFKERLEETSAETGRRRRALVTAIAVLKAATATAARLNDFYDQRNYSLCKG